MKKKKIYRVAQTYKDGGGCLKNHGEYNNIFSAFWKYFKLNFGPHPLGKTSFYVETIVDEEEGTCP